MGDVQERWYTSVGPKISSSKSKYCYFSPKMLNCSRNKIKVLREDRYNWRIRILSLTFYTKTYEPINECNTDVIKKNVGLHAALQHAFDHRHGVQYCTNNIDWRLSGEQ